MWYCLVEGSFGCKVPHWSIEAARKEALRLWEKCERKKTVKILTVAEVIACEPNDDGVKLLKDAETPPKAVIAPGGRIMLSKSLA